MEHSVAAFTEKWMEWFEGQLGEMRRDVTSRLDSLVDRLIGINKET